MTKVVKTITRCTYHPATVADNVSAKSRPATRTPTPVSVSTPEPVKDAEPFVTFAVFVPLTL